MRWSSLLPASPSTWCVRGEIGNGRSEAVRSRPVGLQAIDYDGRDQNFGARELVSKADDFGLGPAARTPLPFALYRRRHLLHRHLDAERGRGLADDSAHHVAVDGEPGYCRHYASSISSD